MIPDNITVVHGIDYQNYTTLKQTGSKWQLRPELEQNPPMEDENGDETFQGRRRHGATSVLSKKRLDLYLPNSRSNCSSEKLITALNDSKIDDNNGGLPPLVVFVHGGGWRRGDRQQWRHFISTYDTNLLFAMIFRLTGLYCNIGETFADNGIACAVISYPLIQPNIFVTLVEFITSFFMSTFLFTALFTWLMLLLHLLCVPFTNIHVINQMYAYLNQNSRLSVLLSFVPLCLIVSQLFIWLCICLNITNYRQGQPKCIVLSIPLAVLVFMTYFGITQHLDFDFYLWTLSIFVTVFLQSSVALSQILFTYNTEKITCIDQIKAVAKSIRWLKTHGQITHQYDVDKIVLIGHSAGSHLINMLTVDDSYLKEVDLSRKDIKGVISLSGIHDLRSLNFCLARCLYLSSFGKDPDIWDKLSPTKLVNKNMDDMPKYLIISAERDYDFFKRDALNYVRKLHRYGYEVHYETIPNTNHLSLPMGFRSSQGDRVLEQICSWFVKQTDTKHSIQDLTHKYKHRL